MQNRNIQGCSDRVSQVCFRMDGLGVLGRNPERPEFKNAEDSRYSSLLSVTFRIFSKCFLLFKIMFIEVT